MTIRIFLLFFVCSINASAVTLTQTVPSDVLFDLNLVTPTEAGTYFATSQSSSSSATLLSVGDIPSTTKWTMYGKLTTTIPGIKVRIKRTGNGTGSTAPNGGLSNKRLNDTTWRKLFSGKGSRLNIPLQTEVYGIGVGDGHGTFEGDIEFKVETQ
ncbi:MAG: hypothetical protein V3U78_08975 [Thiotrichaceae bacterium]